MFGLVLSTACSSTKSAEQSDEAEETAQQEQRTAEDSPPSDEKEVTVADSEKVPVGDSPVLGPVDAPVTVVEFADYQCPYCSKSHKTMESLREEYGDEVRFVFKHNPLPFHKQAKPAARAAVAAGEQGKFWEMHDLLFRYQKVMKGKSDQEMEDWAAGFAQEMGLDVEQFRADFNSERTQEQVEEDMALAKELGARGTPHFLVNGRRITGAQPEQAFAEVIEDELDAAADVQDIDKFYKRRVAKNYGSPIHRSRNRASVASRSRMCRSTVDDPMTGELDDPLVTVVVFSDFQCPFCAKAAPTMRRSKKNMETRFASCSSSCRFPFTSRPTWLRRLRWRLRSRASSGRCTIFCSSASERCAASPTMR